MILTVNSGSTSVKLAAFAGADLRLLHAQRHSGTMLSPADVLADFLDELPMERVAGVAHRIVHGGMHFTQPVRIDDDIQRMLPELEELAPLHNPPAMRWIAAAREVCGPATTHVAVFDTAFFAHLPAVAAQYAVPASLGVSMGVRRYGFHGIAHEAVWRRWCALNPQLPRGGRLISFQLGGGCSIVALDAGRPLDVSMGFSPLEGLVMATRAGDLDPAVVPYLEKRLGLSSEEIVSRLNREAGLLGLSGRSSDVNDLIADASPEAQLAIELYCYRARKYLGAFCAVLGGCDGIAFSGGVGEHVPHVRERILSGMEWAGVELDRNANRAATSGEARIDGQNGRVGVRVLPADEEASLARAALPFTTLG